MSRSETSMLLAMVSSVSSFAWVAWGSAGLGGEEAADEAGQQVQRHDEEDEHQGCAPGPCLSVLRGDPGLRVRVVDEDRQGYHPLAEQVHVHRVGRPGDDQ